MQREGTLGVLELHRNLWQCALSATHYKAPDFAAVQCPGTMVAAVQMHDPPVVFVVAVRTDDQCPLGSLQE